MLGSFKRFFASQGLGLDLGAVSEWAQRSGHQFKRIRDDEGFVIEGVLEGRPWRMEWGPPQRPYIAGRELRLRIELDLPSDLQMLVLAKPLMDLLEKQAYEQFTQSNQTQIDTSTPEEMRWLVMFGRVAMTGFKPLRQRFGAVAASPEIGLAWLDGPLALQLERAAATVLRDDPPFLLMTLRGRIYLRLQLADPDVTAVAAAMALFEVAVPQALRVAVDHSAPESGPDWPSTASTAWQSLRPDGPPKGKRR